MINKVILIGRLGQDPEIKETERQTKLATFSIATSESWKDKNGERQTKTDWHRIVVFNDKLVKNYLEPYLKKGCLVYIEGKIRTRMFETNGERKYITEIILENFGGELKILDSKEDGEKPKPKEEETLSKDQEQEAIKTFRSDEGEGETPF